MLSKFCSTLLGGGKHGNKAREAKEQGHQNRYISPERIRMGGFEEVRYTFRSNHGGLAAGAGAEV